MASLASISQTLGNPSQQTTVFSVSLRPLWKASIETNKDIAAFLDVEKAIDNVWHNGLRYKIYQLDLPTKLCIMFSDFLVRRVIQVKIEDFCLQKFTQKQVSHKVQLESITFPHLCQ